MSVRKKIIGGFIVVFILGLVLGIVGLISTDSLTKMTDEQYTIQNASNSVAGVLSAHYVWRQGLTEAVFTMSPFTGSLDPDKCALGKWKNSDEARAISDSEVLSLLQQLDEPHRFIHTEATTVIALINAGDREKAEQYFMELILPKTQDAISILSAISDRYDVLLAEKGTEIVNFGNTMTTIIIVLIAAALVVCVILAWLITTSIMKPISKMAESALLISTGDLDVQINYPVKDEIGKLADAFHRMLDSTKEQVYAAEQIANGDLTITVTPRSDKDAMVFAFQKMLDNLSGMFSDINASTAQVATASKQIADGSQALAQGSTEQAAAVQQLSCSISEIADKTRENANMAVKAAKLANAIMNNAEKGSHQMDEMMAAVKDINEASQNINRVIKVIDDIAFQTNILALNAAVEAARAGQHGKGFAVVAEEVRSLAAKSAEAAKDTGSLIANSIEKAELGARIAGETAISLTEIVTGISESNKLVDEIAKSSEEQSAGISQINRGIEQVAQVVQQNSATAEESAAASEEMNSQSDILEQLISQFKLNDSMNNRSAFAPASVQKRHAVSDKSSATVNNKPNEAYGKY